MINRVHRLVVAFGGWGPRHNTAKRRLPQIWGMWSVFRIVHAVNIKPALLTLLGVHQLIIISVLCLLYSFVISLEEACRGKQGLTLPKNLGGEYSSPPDLHPLTFHYRT